MGIRSFVRRSVVSKAALVTAMLLAPVQAYAQEDADGAEEETASAEPIIVTGSRLGRTSFNSPTPVTVVGAERMENLGIANVGDALNEIPAFRPIATPSTNSFATSANIAARAMDLRGLGTTRTLTLVDGRRMIPTADNNTFDLNSIPSILVERSEVVTGGASAAYGANAIAGVVNLILDTDLEGIKSELSYGISEYGDAEKVTAAFAGGTSFAAGRGHAVFAAEFADEGGTGDYSSRDWSAQYHSFIPNPFWSATEGQGNGLPANVAIDNVLYVLNPAGIIDTPGGSPLQGTQFDNDGNLIPFQFGDLYDPLKPSAVMVGGDPSLLELYGFNRTPLLVPARHYAALGHVEYDVSDTVTAFAELSYSRLVGGPTAGADRLDRLGAITIRRDNAFLTPSTAAAMDAAGLTQIRISRSNKELGSPQYTSTEDIWRGLFGLRGDLGANFDWDAYYSYGHIKGDLEATKQRITARWNQAIDAVFAPAGIPGIAEGTIICRSTIAAPTNGCAPANVMGPNKISAAAAGWVNDTAWQTRKYTQHAAGINLRGTLFEGWAGPVSAAVGGEWRRNTSEGEADALSIAGAFQGTQAVPLPATTQEVVEGYAEVNVPLLTDSAIGDSLAVDGAIRLTHYNVQGSATTWKGGLVWEISPEYMIRVTRSRDIRAPSPDELNPNQSLANFSQVDPKYNIQYTVTAYSGGNPDLDLERGDTFTAGMVFQPGWLEGFRLAVDYYDIKVKGAIDQIGRPTAAKLCREGNTAVCLVGTDANGNPDRILELYATYQNVNVLKARGIEAVANYSLEVSDQSTLNFTLNGNYVDTLSTLTAEGELIENAGVTGNTGSVLAIVGVPRWRADAVVTFSRPTWSVTTQLKYIPEGILNRDWLGPQDEGYSPHLPDTVSDNRVSGRFYMNLNARVKLFGDGDQAVELFGGITNLFDTDPPDNLRFTGNGLYFDPIGRAYRGGVRVNW